jgi:hypothetical protein
MRYAAKSTSGISLSEREPGLRFHLVIGFSILPPFGGRRPACTDDADYDIGKMVLSASRLRRYSPSPAYFAYTLKSIGYRFNPTDTKGTRLWCACRFGENLEN